MATGIEECDSFETGRLDRPDPGVGLLPRTSGPPAAVQFAAAQCHCAILHLSAFCSPQRAASAARAPWQVVAEGMAAASGSVGSATSSKPMIFGGPGHDTHLGCLNCGTYATDYVFNEFSQDGSSYSPTSIFWVRDAWVFNRIRAIASARSPTTVVFWNSSGSTVLGKSGTLGTNWRVRGPGREMANSVQGRVPAP